MTFDEETLLRHVHMDTAMPEVGRRNWDLIANNFVANTSSSAEDVSSLVCGLSLSLTLYRLKVTISYILDFWRGTTWSERIENKYVYIFTAHNYARRTFDVVPFSGDSRNYRAVGQYRTLVSSHAFIHSKMRYARLPD